MKKLLLAITFFSLSSLGNAQNKSWIMAPKYIKNMSNPTQEPLPTTPGGYQGLPAQGGQNIITDPSGAILFFIVDKNIYGRSGQLISSFPFPITPNTAEPNGLVSEIVVIPDPVDCNLFHLLTTGRDGYGGGSGSVSFAYGAYLKLKIVYDNAGNLLPQSGLVNSDPNSCFGDMQIIENMVGPEFDGDANSNNTHDLQALYAVSPKTVNNEYKVFVANKRRIFVFTLDASGLSYDNYFHDMTAAMPFGYYMQSQHQLRGSIELIALANGNLRLGVPVTFSDPTIDGGQSNSGAVTLDFTNAGTFISGSRKILPYKTGLYQYDGTNNIGVQDMEFTPNGNRVFVSHQKFGPTNSTLDYWDISGTPSKTELSSLDDYRLSQIELDVNGNMLLPRQNFLARISNISSVPVLNNTAIPIASYGVSSDGGFANPIRILQDQIDGMSYAGIAPSISNAYIYNVTTSGTWKPNTAANSYNQNPLIYGFGSVAYIEKELRIKAGKSLTIENMTLVFAPGARVVIENGVPGSQGGKLFMKNTTFTGDDRCGKDQLWFGVEVWGNQNQSQGSTWNTSQGYLNMNLNSSIEHAQVGILVSKRNSEVYPPEGSSFCPDVLVEDMVVFPVTLDATRSGGIVITRSSTLYNNQIGVHFTKHMSPSGLDNLSRFDLTKFRWKGALKGSNPYLFHMALYEVKGITVRGCDFNSETLHLGTSGNALEGTGILSVLSDFNVSDLCLSFDPVGTPCSNSRRSTFNNLNYGVYSLHFTLAKSFSITNSDFKNDRYGVYSLRSEKANLTKNNFFVREADYQTGGALFRECNGYVIQENNFEEWDTITVTNGTGLSVGCWIDNSGINHNEVYKNTFTRLRVGGQSDRINGSKWNAVINDATTGLQWRCNTFNAPIYLADLGVNGVIDKEQGVADATSAINAKRAAARNKFSIDANTNTQHDIRMFTPSVGNQVWPNIQTIAYYQLNDPFYLANDVHPFVTTAFAQFGGMNVDASGDICPSKINTGISWGPKIIEEKNAMLSETIKLTNGGSQSLLSAIASDANSSNTQQALLAASPYLSDEVLIAYLNSRADIGKIEKVLVANSSLSAAVYNAMIASSLPNGSKNKITSVQSTPSERVSLNQRIGLHTDRFVNGYNQYISALLLDTSFNVGYDSLKAALIRIDHPVSKRDLLAIQIELGESEANETMKEIAPFENEYFIALSKLNQLLQPATSTYDALTENPGLIDDLNNLIENSTCHATAEAARNILACVNPPKGAPDFLPLISPSAMSLSGGSNQQTNSEVKYELLPLLAKLYPNPSTGIVQFDFSSEEEGTFIIQLLDLTGKEVFRTSFDASNSERVDFATVKKGVYLVRISIGENYSETQLLELR